LALGSALVHAETVDGNAHSKISSTPCLRQTFEFTSGLQGDHFKYRLSCPTLDPIGNATLEVKKGQNSNNLCRLANFGRSHAEIEKSSANQGFIDLVGWQDGCTTVIVTISIFPIKLD